MVMFSLFGRKDGRTADRKRGAAAAPSAPRPGVPARAAAPTRTRDPREVARLAAARIDEIESEMIAAQRLPPSEPVQGGPPAPDAVAGGRAEFRIGGARPGAQPSAPRPAAGAGRPGLVAEAAAATPAGAALVEVAGANLPPPFEEAAVLFSNGQSTAAAMILWQAIEEGALGTPALQRQAWWMLFDLHQATGQQADFESLAIDYSTRFETSPPAWDDSLAPPTEAPAAATHAQAPVSLPTVLDASAVRQLEQLQRAAQRRRTVALDACAVRSVDAAGAELLLRVLGAFARSRHELSVRGVESLLAVNGEGIEAGRRDIAQARWLLQLELLRLLGRESQFEDLAIDYCVTFEVSPPAWEPMPGAVRPGGPEPGAERVAPRSSRHAAGTEAFALHGEILGRLQEELTALRTFSTSRAEVVIDCRGLHRLDFVAAGEVLNEVVALRGRGKYLVFKDSNQLVAALLTVMGVSELAEIRVRRP
jgi:anti-anti-sigma regulatory factor